MHRNIKILIILCISLQMVDVRESEDSSRDFEGHFLGGQEQHRKCCVCLSSTGHSRGQSFLF